VSARGTPSGGQPPSAGDDADRWEEAAWLRGEHPGWAIVWLAVAGEFHAYKRLPGARSDSALAAATAGDLAAQIDRAEQAAARTRRAPGTGRD
jgi:hypothetical protein